MSALRSETIAAYAAAAERGDVTAQLGAVQAGDAKLAVYHQASVVPAQPVMNEWTRERLDLIKHTYCRGATDAEYELFVGQCKRLRLSPEARQIWSVARKNKDGTIERSTQVSIDGFRLVAERSGKYAGQTPVEWCGTDGVWTQSWIADGAPVAARVGVHRTDFKEPLVRFARLKSFAQYSPFWSKMPEHMIAKVAEALALRAAFPNDLSGVYIPEEMGGAESEMRADDAEHRSASTAATVEARASFVDKADVNPSDAKAPAGEAKVEEPYIPTIAWRHPKKGEPMSSLDDESVINYIRSVMHGQEANAKSADPDRYRVWFENVLKASKTYAATRGITDFSRAKADRAAQLKAAVDGGEVVHGEGKYAFSDEMYMCENHGMYGGDVSPDIRTWISAGKVLEYIGWLNSTYNQPTKAARIMAAERCVEKITKAEADAAERALAK